MTQEQIKEQVAVIEKTGAEIRKSKESTREFLVAAGIIKTATPKQALSTSTPK